MFFLVPFSECNHFERTTMAKDRDTMAKRQRESQKRDKAARKREKKVRRHLETEHPFTAVSKTLETPTVS
jgi:hypothetical protein